jgi:(2Fe-2S) ferredoxin
MLQSLRRPLAQLLFCQGCCCGRTDRGKPELPVEKLKAAWAEHKLNRSVQLTISGCLGPCEQTNVTLLLTPNEQIWLGQLAGEDVYEAFIQWAKDCEAAEACVPLPDVLESQRLSRWATREAVG